MPTALVIGIIATVIYVPYFFLSRRWHDKHARVAVAIIIAAIIIFCSWPYLGEEKPGSFFEYGMPYEATVQMRVWPDADSKQTSFVTSAEIFAEGDRVELNDGSFFNPPCYTLKSITLPDSSVVQCEGDFVFFKTPREIKDSGGRKWLVQITH